MWQSAKQMGRWLSRPGPQRPPSRLHSQLRETLTPIAESLAAMYGFQLSCEHTPKDGDDDSVTQVAGSAYNCVEAVVGPLHALITRSQAPSFRDALDQAVRELHERLLANTFRWLKHVGLDGAWNKLLAFDGPHAATLRTSRRLHEVLLYQMIYGEAANLRHMPELIAFLTSSAPAPFSSRRRATTAASPATRRTTATRARRLARRCSRQRVTPEPSTACRRRRARRRRSPRARPSARRRRR